MNQVSALTPLHNKSYRFLLILSSKLRLDLLSGFPFLVIATKILYVFFISSYVLHVTPILSSIWSFKPYLAKSKNYKLFYLSAP